MEKQLTGREAWAEVVIQAAGTFYVPLEQLCLTLPEWIDYLDDESGWLLECEALLSLYLPPGKFLSVKKIKGYGARLSAPGYLDCTDWIVFQTEDEAWSYLQTLKYSEVQEDENQKN
jgi:hypothetical protein